MTLTGHLLIFVQGIVLTPFVIKIAGPETFGTYTIFLSYLGFVYGISSFGVGIRAKRFLPSANNINERADLFFPQFAFQLLSITLLGCASLMIFEEVQKTANLNNHGISNWMIPGYLIVHTIYSQSCDYYRYTHRVGLFNLGTVLHPYLFMLIATGGFWLTNNLSAGTLISSLLIATFFIGTGMYVSVYREIGFSLRIGNIARLREEVRIGFPLLMSYVVDFILAGGDRFIIAALLSIKDVGYYVPAYMLGSLIIVLPRALGVVLPPILSKHIDSGDEAGAKKLTSNGVHVFLLISIPYVIGSALVGRSILAIYTTQEIADVAWPIVPIVAMASVFHGLLLIRSNVLFVKLRTIILLKVNLISMVLNVAVNVILLKMYANVIAAAVATLLAYIFSYYWLSYKMDPGSAYPKIDRNIIHGAALASIGMGITITLLKEFVFDNYGFIQIAAIIISGTASYSALIFTHPKTRALFGDILKSPTRI